MMLRACLKKNMRGCKIKFIDLNTQYAKIKDSLNVRLANILNQGDYILGQSVIELESKLANYVNNRFCLTCASGTDALLIPLMAKGISRGDAVFTTTFSFFATAEVIALAGATPVFVDIEPDTFNMCPKDLNNKIKKTISDGKLIPKCIIPVNIFGLIADYEKIMEISNNYDLFVIEDAAQSFGASKDNRYSCGLAHVGATSFYPAKPLGCYGDGGAIFTNDEELYHKMKSIRVHGEGKDKYHNDRIGLNSRLDTIQAAVLLEKIKLLDEEINNRNFISNLYKNRLSEHFLIQASLDNSTSAWAQFSLLAKNNEDRQQILSRLSKQNIPYSIYYSIPLHLQKAFSKLNYKTGDLPIAEDICSRIFSLPMHPYLLEEDVDKITNVILNEE